MEASTVELEAAARFTFGALGGYGVLWLLALMAAMFCAVWLFKLITRF